MGCRQKGCHARGPHGQVVGPWPLVGDKGVIVAGGPPNFGGNIRRDDGDLPRRRVNGSDDTEKLLGFSNETFHALPNSLADPLGHRATVFWDNSDPPAGGSADDFGRI